MSAIPNVTAPRVVCFDLAGVLCQFDPSRRWSELGEASGLSPDEVQARLAWVRLIDRADSGNLAREQEFLIARDALGLSCDYERYRAMWCAAFAPMSEILEIVRSVHAQITTAILTNNGPVLLDALRHDLAEVSQNVDHLFVSAQFGATKPSLAVYEGVASALGASPSSIVLVDDTRVNVEGAIRARWQGVHFTGAPDLRADLSHLGLSI